MHTLRLPRVTDISDRMTIAVFVAVVAHLIVVLGISFEDELKPTPSPSPLDILLVQSKPDAPATDDAELPANQSQDGGGEDHKTEPNPAAQVLQPSDHPVPTSQQQAPIPAAASTDVPAVEQDQPIDAAKPVLTTARGESFTSPASGRPRPRAKPYHRRTPVTPSTTEEVVAQQPTPTAAQLISSGLTMAGLPPELDQRLAAYSKRKAERTKPLTSRTREYKYASYMEAWRAKVERIGNLNYPDEARRKRLSGKLTLNVRLAADGKVKRVTISKSSGQKVLDDAAVRIVRLSAPFAPFPPSFRDEVDYLDIHRTWRFSNTGQLAAN